MSINEIIRNASSSNASARFSSTASDAQNTTSSEVRTCGHCGAVIGENETSYEFLDTVICSDCYFNETCTCDCCDEQFWRDDMMVTKDEELVCEECLSNNYVYCEECEQYVREDDANWCEDELCYVCEDCLNSWRNDYYRCERCGDVHHGESYTIYTGDDSSEEWCERCCQIGDTFYCENCGREFTINDVSSQYIIGHGYVCEYCDNDDEQETADIESWVAPYGVRSYGYKPTPCFLLTEKEKEDGHDYSDTICYGVELEMEDHRNYGNNVDTDAAWLNEKLGFTYCKHDGSLNDGLELVSHPASFDYWMSKKDVLEEAFKEMSDMGYTSHDNGHCGLHVHISLKPLLEANPSAPCAMLLLFERFWDKLVRFTRRTEAQLNQWARRYYTKDKPYEELAKMSKRECNRYMAVNLQNDYTVELRVFRGTLKIETFIATLQFCKRLVDICIKSSLQELQTMTWEDLVGNEYEELNAYCKKRFDPQPVTFEDHTVFEDNAPEEHTEDETPAWWPDRLHMHGENILRCETREMVLRAGCRFGLTYYDAGTPVTVRFADMLYENYGICLPDGAEALVPADTVIIVGDAELMSEDWVRVVGDPNTGELPDSICDYNIGNGQIGRVVIIDASTGCIGVDFGYDIGGISLRHNVTHGHGLWIAPQRLELL